MQRHKRIERRTPIRSTTGFARRASSLNQRHSSPTNDAKDRIQDLLRSIVIIRDGGCILRNIHYPDFPECNGYRKDGKLVLQADHLITRGNGATYADSRLVVCVCKGHHGWKSVGGNARKEEYDAIVRSILPADRVELWDKCEEESKRAHRKFTFDWLLEEAALKQELTKLMHEHPDALDTLI